jgi:hypothetical protein
MKNAVALLFACVAALVLPVQGQTFFNLDFEQARLPDPPPDPGFLEWSDAAPGWSHSDGDSTEHVYYLDGHLGHSQWYALLDNQSPYGIGTSPFGAASGRHAFRMRNGTFYEHEPRGPFTSAFLSQTGTVPVGARTVSLLASDFRFGLSFDGTPIVMRPVGLDPHSPTFEQDLWTYSGEWTGDIGAFAGSVVTLVIRNTTPFDSLAFDEIRFLPIPEPATASLMSLGTLAVLLAAARLRRRARAAASRSPSGSAAEPRA